jgi:hypothetical protein
MHWFRTRLRLGSYIALLALAFQLVISFGHVHLHGIGAQASTATEATDGTTPAPADHDGSDGADHYCAICALIHLVGAVALAETPSIHCRCSRAVAPGCAVKFGWVASPYILFCPRASSRRLSAFASAHRLRRPQSAAVRRTFSHENESGAVCRVVKGVCFF